MTAMNNDYLYIAKPNSLIRSKYILTLSANKLLDVALNELKINSYEEDLIVELHGNTIKRITGIGNIYAASNKKAAQSLKGLVIGIYDDTEKKFRFVEMIKDVDCKGKFKFIFNKDIKPLLINIDKRFTKLYFQHIMSLTKVTSYRLYQLIESVAYPGSHECSIDDNNTYRYTITLAELRLILGSIDVVENEVQNILNNSSKPDYKKAVAASSHMVNKEWRDFKRNVLDPAASEITKKTDLNLSFTTQRDGQKIDKVVFSISYKENTQNVPAHSKQEAQYEFSTDKIAEVKAIVGEISDKEAEILLKCAHGDVNIIQEKYKIFDTHNHKIEIANIMGWLISAIRDDYQQKVSPIKSNWNSSYTENDYDFAALEAQLLDN